MREIGVYAARTHLASLLERVEKGERFVITRHGRAVAELVPASRRDVARIRRAIEDLKEFQKTHNLGGSSVRTMVKTGRKR
ncbi:MAG TPA: type II toxin-antitoxin system prevent-host-death family antitoxin [Thermoanaerobaculia bacterium]|nr:type II toxin-antitoxin system prevent-host-death family antitoxin [Thermoanaerobaculia bacterium]